MKSEHVISNEVMDEVYAALSKNEHWMVYNTISYFLEKEGICFFRTREEADEFCQNNYSDHDSFKAVHIASGDDLIKKFSYGERLDDYLKKITHLNELKIDLEKLGFSETIFHALEFYYRNSQDQFQLLQRDRSENEKINYLLHFKDDDFSKVGGYNFTGYEATLRIAPEIPNVTIKGIGAKELDGEMKSVDWSIDHHNESLVEDYLQTQEGTQLLDRIESILEKVDKLYATGMEGKDAAEKLMYKHWYGEVWEPTGCSLDHVKEQCEWKHNVNLKEHPTQTKLETYNVLRTKASERLALMEADKNPLAVYLTKAYWLLDEKLIKENEELPISHLSYKEANLQNLLITLRKAGFEELINDELERNIRCGHQAFDITVPKELEREKVTFQLHFGKAVNDRYFLKNYDATLYRKIPVQHAIINDVDT